MRIFMMARRETPKKDAAVEDKSREQEGQIGAAAWALCLQD